MTEQQILDDLATIFAEMDQAWDRVAASAGFQCNGCEDNCCRTLFYHHTLIEYRFLKEGLSRLAAGDLKKIRQRADKAIRLTEQAQISGELPRAMCPLNEKGRCRLYRFRPMICRLHGIPHQMQRPDGRGIEGPGCDDFYRQCGPKDHPVLDRTPHYVEMARLERQLRQATGYTGKIKMTIAQIILSNINSCCVPNHIE